VPANPTEIAQQALHLMGDYPAIDDGETDWVRPAKGFTPFVGFTAVNAKMSAPHVKIPETWKEAMESPDKELWKGACYTEADRLDVINAWELIDRKSLPPGIKPIPGRWVFTVKLQDDGTYKYKARWVIRGNLMKGDPFYGETYAPVVYTQTTLILFAIATHFGWYIGQADAVQAFLNGILQIPVYMRQPTGFHKGDPNTLFCKLNNALYGLTPSARIWYDRLRTDLEALYL
jgi:hypothetical protein